MTSEADPHSPINGDSYQRIALLRLSILKRDGVITGFRPTCMFEPMLRGWVGFAGLIGLRGGAYVTFSKALKVIEHPQTRSRKASLQTRSYSYQATMRRDGDASCGGFLRYDNSHGPRGKADKDCPVELWHHAHFGYPLDDSDDAGERLWIFQPAWEVRHRELLKAPWSWPHLDEFVKMAEVERHAQDLGDLGDASPTPLDGLRDPDPRKLFKK